MMMPVSCHSRALAIAVLLGLAQGFTAPAFAQGGPGIHEDNSGLNGSLTHDDLQKLGGDKSDANAGLTREAVLARAKAKADSEQLLKALQLTCQVSNAQVVMTGTSKSASGAKEIDTRVYEVACAAGMGYVLEQQGSAKPMAISCLTAEEARAADVAKGKPAGFYCKLPENVDVYGTVTAMIATGTGASCTVRDLQLFGRSESTQSDYSEVACKDGKGFLLRTPLPGSQAETIVMSCADAARKGIKCRLTDAGPVEAPVTMDTLKDALAQHGVSCRIDQIRMIGQEDNRKRYVVEYRCADQTTAMVAFIPLSGNANPYEALDCADAITRGVACTFSSTH
jgi:hypothetical protein